MIPRRRNVIFEWPTEPASPNEALRRCTCIILLSNPFAFGDAQIGIFLKEMG